MPYWGFSVAELNPALSVTPHFCGTEVPSSSDGHSRSSFLVIATIDSLGPAWESGLRQGDVLIAIDGMPVQSRAEFLKHTRRSSVGQIVSIQATTAAHVRHILQDVSKSKCSASLKKLKGEHMYQVPIFQLCLVASNSGHRRASIRT